MISIVLVWSCKKNESEPHPGDTIISEATLIIDTMINHKANVVVETSRLIFSQTTQETEKIKVGNILASAPSSDAPFGYLRKVKSISNQSGQLVIETEPAKLEEAIKQCDVEFEYQYSPDDTLRSNTFELDIFKTIYDQDNNPNTTNNQISFSGQLSITCTFIFKLQIENNKVKYFKAGTQLINSQQLAIDAELPLLNIEKEVLIKKWLLEPKVIPIGGFPVVVTNELNVWGKVKANSSISYHSVFTSTTTRDAYVIFENSTWDKVHNVQNTDYIEEGNPQIQGNVKYSLVASLDFFLYDLENIRSSLALEGFLKLNVTANANTLSEWAVKYGYDLNVQINVEVLGYQLIDFQAQLLGNETQFAEGIIDTRDGRAYSVITTTGRKWLGENLKYDTPFSRCYDDNEQNCGKYGRLYDIIELAKTSTPNVCPVGWRIPSAVELESIDDGYPFQELIQGGSSKMNFSLGGAYVQDFFTAIWYYGGKDFSELLVKEYPDFPIDPQTKNLGVSFIYNGVSSGFNGPFSDNSFVSCRCIKE